MPGVERKDSGARSSARYGKATQDHGQQECRQGMQDDVDQVVAESVFPPEPEQETRKTGMTTSRVVLLCRPRSNQIAPTRRMTRAVLGDVRVIVPEHPRHATRAGRRRGATSSAGKQKPNGCCAASGRPAVGDSPAATVPCSGVPKSAIAFFGLSP